jgi:hypothetical protein
MEGARLHFRRTQTTAPLKKENPMASILFTILPVVLTFTLASWSPNSKQAKSAPLQTCTNC